MSVESSDDGQWGSRIGFILAAIGSAVGLGNIWRFSYMAYDNGGGAFLIPYFFALLTAGIPILIMEFGFGHKMRGSAPFSFAKMGKKWEWLGWWQVLVSFVIATYYVVVISWSLNYVTFSFNRVWGENPEAYFFGDFLQITDGISQIGGINFSVLISLLIVWGVSYIILYNGIEEGIEKASKIFMPLLALFMIIITIRGVTLPGAMAGINKFLEPDFSALTDVKVWLAAYGQIFFTLSVGFAIMITYSSYLPEDSDIVNNAFITALSNSAFSFIVGIGVFGILGYMAAQTGEPISKVVTSGIGLAFVAFPKAINMLPAFRSLFGVIFFLALAIAGFSSCVSILEAVIAAVRDKFDIGRKAAVNYVCSVGAVISLLYTTGAGLYFLDIVDHFINQFGIALAGLVECIIIGWFYKVSIIREHANRLSDFAIGSWWDIMIRVITPICLGVAFVQNTMKELAAPYGGYPMNAILKYGWSVAAGVIVLGIIMSLRPWKGKKSDELISNREVM
ncbi:sodium-dependent transporter [Acetohalobium arabaticum]|uniref:Sodium:neurotransmitter symporter n=1 Tax=Acetohalobium arabaticum (strain ATCC 49924 / DSM 5501 / Z-7288) TaxID=574087 RepID=D9QRT5_ACEAZ|nr:sodium-dependent transporter [Acetohalobium arabaticum]ADL13226.1 sodium:neurotransmitter symporter [Acetohalobium arabaticum DSM 5501]